MANNSSISSLEVSKAVEVLERLRQSILRLNKDEMRKIAESDVFDMRAIDQITRHFEYVVIRNRAELRGEKHES